MNYYNRHLGDYARDTGHLTALEHGIYNLLLDSYYSTEKPIPHEKAHRIAKANPDETLMVLSEFFKKTPKGWVHARADREIAKYNEKAERNREVGKLGGRPKVTQTVTQEEPRRFPELTLASNQEPIQKQKQKTAPEGDLLKDVDPQVAKDFKALRTRLRAPITATAIAGIQREAVKAGLTFEAALVVMCEHSWRGFKAEWLKPKNGDTPNGKQSLIARVIEKNQRNQLADDAQRTADANLVGEDDSPIRAEMVLRPW